MENKKKWKIRSQELRDIFFHFKLFLNQKVINIARQLKVHKSTLYRWLQQGITKPNNPSRTKGNNSIIEQDINGELIDFINNNNTISLLEISEYVYEQYGIKASISTIHRFCDRNNLTYKKGTKSYTEADPIKKQIFLDNIKTQEISEFIILDEASFVLNHSKVYGRSMKGTRAIIENPGKRGKTYSLIIGLSVEKIVSYNLYEGPVDSIKFSSFISNLPPCTLVLDNNSTHHATKSLTNKGFPSIKELASSKKINLLYLP